MLSGICGPLQMSFVLAVFLVKITPFVEVLCSEDVLYAGVLASLRSSTRS